MGYVYSVVVLYNALSQMTVRSLGPGKYADGQGLWLIKRDKQVGKWIVRLVVSGKRREMGLGRYPDVTIGEARERAATARRQLRDGVDPIFDRQRSKRTTGRLTLSEAIDGCFEARKAELKRDGNAGRWMSPLRTHIIPKIGKYPVEEVDQHVLVETLQPLWHSKPEVARKSLNRINATLKYAAALGLEVDLGAPMKSRALLGKQRHQTKHIPALAHDEVPTFYQWLTTIPGVTALALRFLMLTVARTTEVRLTTFAEIRGGVWYLPPVRTKNGREHRIPLSDEAMAVVGVARELFDTDLLFPSLKGKPISDAAMAALMKRNGYEARPHGFRASFRTWVEERTDTPFEVKEAALGHAVDSPTSAAYQRSDRLAKRRALMDDWARFVLGCNTTSK